MVDGDNNTRQLPAVACGSGSGGLTLTVTVGRPVRTVEVRLKPDVSWLSCYQPVVSRQGVAALYNCTVHAHIPVFSASDDDDDDDHHHHHHLRLM